jgi:hypothetical protein
MAKKPDAPKFKPVVIAGIRPEINSLTMPEAEAMAMLKEDNQRIVLETWIATMERLKTLQNYLGLSGKLDQTNLLLLLMLVADKYVEGFKVTVGESPKRGAKKIADRFKTVTEIEEMKFRHGLTTDIAAIETVAASHRPSIRPQELQAKYYRSIDDIKTSPPAFTLLKFWRKVRQETPRTVKLQGWEDLFWVYEKNCLGATKQATTELHGT